MVVQSVLMVGALMDCMRSRNRAGRFRISGLVPNRRGETGVGTLVRVGKPNSIELVPFSRSSHPRRSAWSLGLCTGRRDRGDRWIGAMEDHALDGHFVRNRRRAVRPCQHFLGHLSAYVAACLVYAVSFFSADLIDHDRAGNGRSSGESTVSSTLP